MYRNTDHWLQLVRRKLPLNHWFSLEIHDNTERENNSGQTHLFNIGTIKVMNKTSGQPQYCAVFLWPQVQQIFLARCRVPNRFFIFSSSKYCISVSEQKIGTASQMWLRIISSCHDVTLALSRVVPAIQETLLPLIYSFKESIVFILFTGRHCVWLWPPPASRFVALKCWTTDYERYTVVHELIPCCLISHDAFFPHWFSPFTFFLHFSSYSFMTFLIKVQAEGIEPSMHYLLKE